MDRKTWFGERFSERCTAIRLKSSGREYSKKMIYFKNRYNWTVGGNLIFLWINFREPNYMVSTPLSVLGAIAAAAFYLFCKKLLQYSVLCCWANVIYYYAINYMLVKCLVETNNAISRNFRSKRKTFGWFPIHWH